MRCVICKSGETEPGAVTVTVSRDAMTLVLKGVPAEVCVNCGEEYIGAETAAGLAAAADAAARAGVQVEIREFVAA